MHVVYLIDSVPSLRGLKPLWKQPTVGAHKCASGAAATGPEVPPKLPKSEFKYEEMLREICI